MSCKSIFWEPDCVERLDHMWNYYLFLTSLWTASSYLSDFKWLSGKRRMSIGQWASSLQCNVWRLVEIQNPSPAIRRQWGLMAFMLSAGFMNWNINIWKHFTVESWWFLSKQCFLLWVLSQLELHKEGFLVKI